MIGRKTYLQGVRVRFQITTSEKGGAADCCPTYACNRRQAMEPVPSLTAGVEELSYAITVSMGSGHAYCSLPLSGDAGIEQLCRGGGGGGSKAHTEPPCGRGLIAGQHEKHQIGGGCTGRVCA